MSDSADDRVDAERAVHLRAGHHPTNWNQVDWNNLSVAELVIDRELGPVYRFRKVVAANDLATNDLAAYSAKGPAIVAHAPGASLVRFAELLFSKKSALRRIVVQSIADMRDEHFDALASGDLKQARWIAIRGRISTVWAVLVHIGFWAVLGKVVKMWKGE